MPHTSTGILLIDKPPGITSHDVVARVRRLAGTRKVGHGGTLDPLATGLLTLGIGSSTRLLTFLSGLDKEYFATIRLGASTTTDDSEGEITAAADPEVLATIRDQEIEHAIAALTGTISQVPSSFSAIKVNGQRAYDLARAGEAVELVARSVNIDAFEVLATRRDSVIELDVRVECSSGTYIRALARDLGSALGVGGHLTSLRRSRVGPFLLADASVLDDDLDVEKSMLSPADAAGRLFPALQLTSDQVRDLSQGKRIEVEHLDQPTVAAIAPGGRLVGLVAIASSTARVIVNFPTTELVDAERIVE